MNENEPKETWVAIAIDGHRVFSMRVAEAKLVHGQLQCMPWTGEQPNGKPENKPKKGLGKKKPRVPEETRMAITAALAKEWPASRHTNLTQSVLKEIGQAHGVSDTYVRYVQYERAGMLSGCICILLSWNEDRKQFIGHLRGLGVPVHVLVIDDSPAPSAPSLDLDLRIG